MGCMLIDQSPLFRSVLEECDNVLRSLPDGPQWSIIEELTRDQSESKINEAEYSQPLCTTLQIAIFLLLRSWGIRSDAVVGHSSGEICSAFAAGNITMRDAIITAYYRGLVLATKSPNEAQGAMCAVGLGEEHCLELLRGFDDRVQLAAINSPCSCTVSGDLTTIQTVIDLCAERGHFCRRLKVNRGEH